MDTNTLKTFIKLAELKNFTQTAQSLFVAQSTVTNRIADLEKELNKKLFFRDNKLVTLTSEGEIFLTYAKRIVELEKTSIQEINSLNYYHETLRIGTTNTIYECHLYESIRDYMQKHKDSSVSITINHSNNLFHMLSDNLLDIIFTYLSFSKKGYTCECFHTDDLVLVTTPENNLFKEGIYKKDLAKIKYLFCNFALVNVGQFIKELFPPFYQFGFEIDNSTKLIKFLLDGAGYTFLPKSLVTSYIEKNELECVKLLDFDTPKVNCYRMFKNDLPIVTDYLYGL